MNDTTAADTRMGRHHYVIVAETETATELVTEYRCAECWEGISRRNISAAGSERRPTDSEGTILHRPDHPNPE